MKNPVAEFSATGINRGLPSVDQKLSGCSVAVLAYRVLTYRLRPRVRFTTGLLDLSNRTKCKPGQLTFIADTIPDRRHDFDGHDFAEGHPIKGIDRGRLAPSVIQRARHKSKGIGIVI